MTASLAVVQNLLKEVYEPGINKQLNDEVVALRRVERSSDVIETTVGGRFVTFAIKTRRNSGIGARNELEQLPQPGHQGSAAARVGLKYQYGSIRLTGQAFELATKSYQAFVSVLENELDGLKTDLAVDLNRQVYGDGSGKLCKGLNSGGGSNTFEVDSTLYIQMDEMVDILDGDSLNDPLGPTVKASNRQVIFIDTVLRKVTVNGPSVDMDDQDIVVRHGNHNREWTGFAKIIDNQKALFNIDPNVEPVWKAEVDHNSGTNRPLSEGLMIHMADRIRTNGGKVTAIFSNLGVRRAYFNLLTQQRQYVNTKEFTGGFNGLAFTTDAGDIPFVTDVSAPQNLQYFVNEKELTLYRDADWAFMNRDGSMWDRVQGYDAYDATMFQYSELGTHRRNTHGVIKDITEG